MRISTLRSCALTCLLLSGGALAAGAPSVAHFHHDIHIESGQTSGELSCVACSVYVHGQVTGDVAVVFGRLVLGPSASVAGDVAVVAGDLAAGEGSSIGGDVAVVGGRFRRPPDMHVGGDVAVMQGRGWFILIVVAPFVGLVLAAVLIVWIVQLVRRQSRRPGPSYNPRQ